MPEIRRISLVAMAFAILTTGLLPAADGDWTQWRGAARDGIAPGDPWPDSLADDRLKLLWRVDAGRAYSGPVVTADRVYLAESMGEDKEGARAFDRATGRQIWKTEWDGGIEVEAMGRIHGGWIKATPAIDGDALYVVGMRDVLVSLDAATGKERWRLDFLNEFKLPNPAFGAVTSPLIHEGDLFVQAAGSLVKIDPATGAVIWRVLEAELAEDNSAFSSPAIATLGGLKQIVVQTRQLLAGVDPGSGEILWTQEVKAALGMNMMTPLIHGQGVFTSPYGLQSIFYKIDRGEGGFSVSKAWEQKSRGYMSSPVAVGGHVYMHLQNRRLSCIDLDTGEEKWRVRKGFGGYWSMVARGDRILALDGDGELILIRANAEKYDPIDTRTVSENTTTWGHLAVAGDHVLIRRLDGLDVYEWK